MLLAACAALTTKLIATATTPWCSGLNHDLLSWLFRHLPHNGVRDTVAETLTRNPLISTWVFAAALFMAWTRDDAQKAQRRTQLIAMVLAFVVAVSITLALRPWLAWPAPARCWAFRALYPKYFWSMGSLNSFPSHSSLAYFLVALGFWPIHRRLSMLMVALTLVAVALPRMYIGGHYPVDVALAFIIALFSLILVRRLMRPAFPQVARWAVAAGSGGALREVLVFFWIFEVGEGFQYGFEFLMTLLRAAGHYHLNL